MALSRRMRLGSSLSYLSSLSSQSSSSCISYLSNLTQHEGTPPLPSLPHDQRACSSAALRRLPGSFFASHVAQPVQAHASSTGMTSMAQAVAQGMRLPFQISRQASASSKNKDEKKGKNPPPSPETLRRFAVERVKYREQMSVLRKQYASEHAERLREKERQQKAKRDLRTLEQGSGVEAKKEQDEARRIILAQQQVELRKAKEEQRKRNREWRLQLEARIQERKALEMEKLAKESRAWVRERDLDRRILEALDDPYKLHAK